MEEHVLLILGASSDIGMRYLKKNIERYNLVVAQYRSLSDELKEIKKSYGDKLTLYKCDFIDEDETRGLCDYLIQNNIHPDHFVHLPSNELKLKSFSKLQWKEYERGANISLRSAIYLLKVILPDMKKRQYGRIVLMLSSALKDIPKGCADYIVTKYALYGLMRSVSEEYRGNGICINSLSPEMIDSKFLKGQPDIIIREEIESNIAGRILNLNEVVDAISDLLFCTTDVITGQNIYIRTNNNKNELF